MEGCKDLQIFGRLRGLPVPILKTLTPIYLIDLDDSSG